MVGGARDGGFLRSLVGKKSCKLREEQGEAKFQEMIGGGGARRETHCLTSREGMGGGIACHMTGKKKKKKGLCTGGRERRKKGERSSEEGEKDSSKEGWGGK